MLDAQIIEGFVNACLLSKFEGATRVPEMHREWWELCCGPSRFTAIAAPRHHAKSTAITLSFVLASALFKVSKYIIIVSDTEKQASLFLSEVRNELESNEDIIKLFGIKRFVKLTETDIIVELNDGHLFRLMAKGAEQKLRGLKWGNTRPDLIICDDLENEELTENANRREKFRNWFYGALMPILSEKGKLIIVGTILHIDSLLERLMPSYNEETSVWDGLKLYSTKKREFWKSVKYKAHSDDFKQILWKDRYDADHFKALRRELTNQGMPDVYNREYLNYPIDESSAYFKRNDLITFKEQDYQEENLSYYCAIDFAVSKEARRDYTAIAVVGINDQNVLLVKDIRRGRWDAKEIIDEMFACNKRYKPDLFIVERGSIEKALGPFLRQEMMARNQYINLYPMTPTRDKQSRARGLQARLRSGNVRFDKDAEWYLDLEDEMVRFPKHPHDDQVDALSWIGLVLDQIQAAPTKEERAEEEYQEMTNIGLDDGRNYATGY